MAPTLGKRKRIAREEIERRSSTPSSSGSESHGEEDVQALFRRAFEAKFKPLDIEPVQKKVKEVESEEEEEEEEEWSGIDSEDDEEEEEENNRIEVFDYTTDSQKQSAGEKEVSKAEMRAFMVRTDRIQHYLPTYLSTYRSVISKPQVLTHCEKSSKPPTSSASFSTSKTTKPSRASKKEDDEDHITEASHLKNDLALQNLLRESHLLSTHNPTYSTRAINASNNTAKPSSISTRHKLTDLHLQSLGAKTSIYTQKKMPMQFRKGIVAKANLRDDLRRKEARENGIILERKSGSGSGGGKKGERRKERDKGVGAPSVGKFRNGTLTLSRKDVGSITGEGGGGGGRGKGKGKKRGKR